MSQERPPDGRGGPTERDRAGGDRAPPAADEQSLTAAELDSLFELLADPRRRRVLAYLADADDGVATFSELTDHVLGADATDDERDSLAIQLHHVHLPKLEDVGVVEYDARSETVRYRGSPAVAEWVEYVER